MLPEEDLTLIASNKLRQTKHIIKNVLVNSYQRGLQGEWPRDSRYTEAQAPAPAKSTQALAVHHRVRTRSKGRRTLGTYLMLVHLFQDTRMLLGSFFFLFLPPPRRIAGNGVATLASNNGHMIKERYRRACLRSSVTSVLVANGMIIASVEGIAFKQNTMDVPQGTAMNSFEVRYIRGEELCLAGTSDRLSLDTAFVPVDMDN